MQSKLFAVEKYEPIPSVWEGPDDELLERMLQFYPKHPPERILDATVNKGRFWRGSSRPVLGMDIDARHRPQVLGNGANMPFKSETFDVVVYDPPPHSEPGQRPAKGLPGQVRIRYKVPGEDRLQLFPHFPAIRV